MGHMIGLLLPQISGVTLFLLTSGAMLHTTQYQLLLQQLTKAADDETDVCCCHRQIHYPHCSLDKLRRCTPACCSRLMPPQVLEDTTLTAADQQRIITQAAAEAIAQSNTTGQAAAEERQVGCLASHHACGCASTVKCHLASTNSNFGPEHVNKLRLGGGACTIC